MRHKVTRGMLVLAVIWITGCFKGEKRWETAFNEERAKLGIPTIPADWTSNHYGSYIDFQNPRPDTSGPYRLSKRLFLDTSGELVTESDVIYSGKNFMLDGEKVSEALYLQYHHSDKTGWQIAVTRAPKEFLEKKTIEEADQILESWGTKRQ